MPTNKRARNETLASFLDLEAEVNDEEEEGLDDGSDDELDDFLDDSTSSDYGAPALLPRDYIVTPSDRTAIEYESLANNLRERYRSSSTRGSVDPSLLRLLNTNIDSPLEVDAPLGSLGQTWFFHYPHGDPWELSRKISTIPALKDIVLHFVLLPSHPRVFFVYTNASGLDIIQKWTPFPLTRRTSISWQQYIQYSEWGNRPFSYETSSFVRVGPTEDNKQYRGDLARIIRMVQPQMDQDTASRAHPEETVIIALVPRLESETKRKRSTKAQRPRAVPFDAEAYLLKYPLAAHDVSVISSGHRLRHLSQDLNFDCNGLLVMPIGVSNVSLELFPPLDEIQALCPDEASTESALPHIEMALKGNWGTGVNVHAIRGTFKGLDGHTVSPCDTSTATVEVSFVNRGDIMLVPVSDLKLRLQIGDHVYVAWGLYEGKDGIIGSFSPDGIVTIFEQANISIQCSVTHLQPKDSVFFRPPIRSDEAPRASRYLSKYAVVVRGPYAKCVGFVEGADLEEASIFSRETLRVNIQTINHQPSLIQAKQKDVLLLGSNYEAMNGYPLDFFYTEVRIMDQATVMQQQVLWTHSKAPDPKLIEKYPLQILEVPSMFTSGDELGSNGTLKSLVGEPCYIIKGVKKGIRTCIRSIGRNAIYVESIADTGPASWRMKQSDVVLFNRTLTHTMGGERLAHPLRREQIPGEITRESIRVERPLTPPGRADEEAETVFAVSEADRQEALVEEDDANHFLLKDEICKNLEWNYEFGVKYRNSGEDRVVWVESTRFWYSDGLDMRFASPGEVWVNANYSRTQSRSSVKVSRLIPARPKGKNDTVLILAGDHAGKVVNTVAVKKRPYLLVVVEVENTTLSLSPDLVCKLRRIA